MQLIPSGPLICALYVDKLHVAHAVEGHPGPLPASHPTHDPSLSRLKPALHSAHLSVTTAGQVEMHVEKYCQSQQPTRQSVTHKLLVLSRTAGAAHPGNGIDSDMTSDVVVHSPRTSSLLQFETPASEPVGHTLPTPSQTKHPALLPMLLNTKRSASSTATALIITGSHELT